VIQNKDKLTVGVDLRGLEPGFKAHFGRGTGRYAARLYAELIRESSPDFEIRALGTKELSGSILQGKVLQLAPCCRETLRTQLFLPRSLSHTKVDLAHFLAHGDAPARAVTPYVVTVLDLIPLRFPQLYKPEKADWRFWLARKLELMAITRAKAVFAISETTKRDLIELLGIDEARILVTPLASSAEVSSHSGSEVAVVRKKLKLESEGTTLLYIGGIDARKNISFLLKVFRELVDAAKCRSQLPPILILAGAYESDLRYPALLDEIRRLQISEYVRLAGFVTDAELSALYSISTLMVFPSLYEGFGLPVLEAMQAGLPVIAGNNSSIPEVAGEAAVLLPDNVIEEWVKEISNLVQSPDRLAMLSKLGIAQAKKFSWRRTAELTIDGYRQALSYL
jgi:glycosyltransferase involved in cell wall biosynthesis